MERIHSGQAPSGRKKSNGAIDANRLRRMLVLSDCPWFEMFKATTVWCCCQASFTICQLGTGGDKTLGENHPTAGSSGWSFVKPWVPRRFLTRGPCFFNSSPLVVPLINITDITKVPSAVAGLESDDEAIVSLWSHELLAKGHWHTSTIIDSYIIWCIYIFLKLPQKRQSTFIQHCLGRNSQFYPFFGGSYTVSYSILIFDVMMIVFSEIEFSVTTFQHQRVVLERQSWRKCG